VTLENLNKEIEAMTPNIDIAERLKVIGARIAAGKDTYGGAADAWHLLGQVIGVCNLR